MDRKTKEGIGWAAALGLFFLPVLAVDELNSTGWLAIPLAAVYMVGVVTIARQLDKWMG